MISTKSNWPEVKISSRAHGQIRAGSLWIFANEFVTKVASLKAGDWVDFTCDGRFVGFGYVNPHSLITGRICSLVPVEDRKKFLAEKVKGAFKRRENLGFSTSYRLIFSESDNLPGLIADFYSDGQQRHLVLQLGTAGMDAIKDELADVFSSVLESDSLILRGDSSTRRLEMLENFVEIRKGEEAKLKDWKILEDDTFFAADLVAGQKTGFFLDQRANRRHLRNQAQSKTVLDLCCYSGGWGISALMNGAKHVTFVDQSREALDLVGKGLALNHLSESKARFVAADVFDFLESEPSSYDFVVADPPAFVKSKKNLPQAIKAYGKLNSLSLRRLNPEGVLYSSSCSFHLSESDFEEILRGSLQKSGKIGTVVYRGIQSLDHPWVLTRSESRYLKCLALLCND